MTRFLIRNHPGDKFHAVSRTRYKEIARQTSKKGIPFRTEVMYVDGEPCKKLTLL